MITNEQTLIFNIDKIDSDPVNKIIARQGDGYQKTTDVQIKVQDKPYDLSKTVQIGLHAIKPDDKVIIDYDHAKITDGVNGVFTYSFPSGTFATAGDFKEAYFTMLGPDGTLDSTNPFQIKVMQNVVDQQVPSTDYLSPIQKALELIRTKAKAMSQEFDLLVNKAQRDLEDQLKQADDAAKADLVNNNNQFQKLIASSRAQFGSAIKDITEQAQTALDTNQKTYTDFTKKNQGTFDTSMSVNQKAYDNFVVQSKQTLTNLTKDFTDISGQATDLIVKLQTAIGTSSQVNQKFDEFTKQYADVNQKINDLAQSGFKNLVYNSRFTNITNGMPQGWTAFANGTNSQVGFFSTNEKSAYQGVGSIGVNTTNPDWTMFAQSKPMPLAVDNNVDPDLNVYSASMMVKSYPDNDKPNGQVYVTLAFFDADQKRITNNIKSVWSKQANETKGAWEIVKVEGLVPVGNAKYVAIQAWTQGNPTHAMINQPMINVGTTVAPYRPDEVSSVQLDAVAHYNPEILWSGSAKVGQTITLAKSMLQYDTLKIETIDANGDLMAEIPIKPTAHVLYTTHPVLSGDNRSLKTVEVKYAIGNTTTLHIDSYNQLSNGATTAETNGQVVKIIGCKYE